MTSWGSFTQVAYTCMSVVVTLLLLGLTVWGYVSTRLKGMLLLVLWVLWERLAGWGVHLVVSRYEGLGGASGSGQVSMGEIMLVFSMGKSLLGALLLAGALVVLICEVKALREAEASR